MVKIEITIVEDICDRPERIKLWWMWFLSALSGFLNLKILTVMILKKSVNGYKYKDNNNRNLLLFKCNRLIELLDTKSRDK